MRSRANSTLIGRSCSSNHVWPSLSAGSVHAWNGKVSATVSQATSTHTTSLGVSRGMFSVSRFRYTKEDYMSERHEITCDTYGKDITRSSNSVDWRLAVRNEPVPSAGGFVTDMMIYPVIGRDLHFCSWRCLIDSDFATQIHAALAERDPATSGT
jgi:hypothetical protein